MLIATVVGPHGPAPDFERARGGKQKTATTPSGRDKHFIPRWWPPGHGDFDGNKRTARLMMTGELRSSGCDVVSVPYDRRLEHHNALDALFAQDDATELLRFRVTCTL